jgi:hypothetical protein
MLLVVLVVLAVQAALGLVLIRAIAIFRSHR